jgi:hypothetical protein
MHKLVGPRFAINDEPDFCLADRAIGGYDCQYVDVRQTGQARIIGVVRNGKSSRLARDRKGPIGYPVGYDVTVSKTSWRGTLQLTTNLGAVRGFPARFGNRF